ncbi:hypothetical protein LDENG_00003540 [Lucifuga dentata]|nr:hypothetical protein LDENG_00003540 [Lucifuga dentata]
MDPEGSPAREDAMTEQAAEQRLDCRRSEKSLGLLAKRFLCLLQEAQSGILNLKEASMILDVRQKRRIYDITNVLEGIGVLVKISKNIVQWKGIQAIGIPPALARRLWGLRSTLAYVNHGDICSCFNGHTLLAICAPSGTQLDVPIPKAVQNCPTIYQIHLKSINGPIDVVLLNKTSVSSVPFVLPVPPPEEILRKTKSATSLSDEQESAVALSQASAYSKHSRKHRWTALLDTQPLHSPPLHAEPSRTGATDLLGLSKHLAHMLDPTKELRNGNLITEIMASEVFLPLLRMSPPPSEQEYMCSLDDSEGLGDLFDMPLLNV